MQPGCCLGGRCSAAPRGRGASPLGPPGLTGCHEPGPWGRGRIAFVAEARLGKAFLKSCSTMVNTDFGKPCAWPRSAGPFGAFPKRGRGIPMEGSPWRDPHGGWPVRATRRVSLRAAGWDVNLSVSPEAFPPCPTALGARPSTRSQGNICPVDLAALSRESAGSGPTSQMGNRSHEPRGKAASCLWSREESRNSCLPAFFGSFLREPLPGVSNQPGVSRWQEHRNHGRKPAAGSFTPSRAWPPELLGYAQVPRHGVTWGSLRLRFPILNTRS